MGRVTIKERFGIGKEIHRLEDFFFYAPHRRASYGLYTKATESERVVVE